MWNCETDFLIITLDSCRWDVFEKAKTPYLNSLGIFRKAFTHGTYTLPAHKSIYQGILPSVNDNIPFYNRFSKALFRIAHRAVEAKSLVTFDAGTEDVIIGLREYGYNTFGLGAMEWFQHEELTSSFNQFYFTGTHLQNQVKLICGYLTQMDDPFFALLNIGETHEPYEYGGKIKSRLLSREKMREFKNDGFNKSDFNKQIKACEFIDSEIQPIFHLLKEKNRGTVVVICSDHGECFGEDGLYGHGFYHRKIMEVPLAIIQINTNILDK